MSRQSVRSWVGVVLYLVLYSIGVFTLEPWIRECLPQYGYGGDGPPWDSMANDVSLGLALTVVFLISAVVGAIWWRVDRPAAFVLLFISGIHCLGLVAKSIVILVRCDSFFEILDLQLQSGHLRISRLHSLSLRWF